MAVARCACAYRSHPIYHESVVTLQPRRQEVTLDLKGVCCQCRVLAFLWIPPLTCFMRPAGRLFTGKLAPCNTFVLVEVATMGGQQQAKVVSMAATMLAAECDLSSMVNEDILEVRLLHHQHQQNDTALPLAIMLGYSVHVEPPCSSPPHTPCHSTAADGGIYRHPAGNDRPGGQFR